MVLPLCTGGILIVLCLLNIIYAFLCSDEMLVLFCLNLCIVIALAASFFNLPALMVLYANLVAVTRSSAGRLFGVTA